MHWADLNAALYKAGWPPSRVARHLGVATTAVSQTVRGQISSYNIASFVSAVTHIPLNQMFPDGRYDRPPKRRRAAA